MLDNKQQAMVIRGVGLIQNICGHREHRRHRVQGRARLRAGYRPRADRRCAADRHLRRESTTGGVEGIVLMRRGENPTRGPRGIKEAVEELNTNRLPEGVKIAPIYDRTDLVNNTLHTVTHTLLEGLVIVVFVLFLFLGSARAALLTAITIPLSLLFAFVCMHFSGIPGEPAQSRRAGFRHHRRRHAGDGRAHSAHAP